MAIKLVLIFVNHSYERERFAPHGKLDYVQFAKKDLERALKIVKKKLSIFENRVVQLSIKHQLNIQFVDNQLVYVFKNNT